MSLDTEHERLIDSATRWIVLLRSGHATAADWQAWQRWRSEDPRHEQLCQRLDQQLGVFQVPLAQGVRGEVLQHALNAPSSRRKVLQGALVGAGVAVGAGLLAGPLGVPLGDLGADIRTGTAERRTVLLPDGSQLHLNARSAADIDFDQQQRRVRLREGELLVQVAPQADRPFVIHTEQTRVFVQGSRLLVREREGLGYVAALKGALQIDRQSGPRLPVASGFAVSYERDRFGPVQPNTLGATAWLDGLLEVRDRPLSEVIDALRPYRHGVLRLDPAVAGLRVSGLFRLDNPEQILDTLARTLPIRIGRRTGLWVTVSAA